MTELNMTLARVTKSVVLCGIFMGLLSGCGDDDKGASADLGAPPSNEATVNGKSFLNNAGEFDLDKAEELFWSEATDNWGEDDGIGHKTVYVAANRALLKVSVDVNEEGGTFTVETNNCHYGSFNLDNSHPDTWVPGTNGDQCSSKLAKAQKWGSFYTIQIRGFAGLTTAVRAIVFRQVYEVTNTVSTHNNPVSNQLVNVVPKGNMTTWFGKVYFPAQLETDALRGFELEHSMFRSTDSDGNWVSERSNCYKSGHTDYGRIPVLFSSDVQGCYNEINLKSDSAFLDLILNGDSMTFEMSDSDGYSYYDSGEKTGAIGLEMTFQPVAE